MKQFFFFIMHENVSFSLNFLEGSLVNFDNFLLSLSRLIVEQFYQHQCTVYDFNLWLWDVENDGWIYSIEHLKNPTCFNITLVLEWINHHHHRGTAGETNLENYPVAHQAETVHSPPLTNLKHLNYGNVAPENYAMIDDHSNCKKQLMVLRQTKAPIIKSFMYVCLLGDYGARITRDEHGVLVAAIINYENLLNAINETLSSNRKKAISAESRTKTLRKWFFFPKKKTLMNPSIEKFCPSLREQREKLEQIFLEMNNYIYNSPCQHDQ